MPLPMAMGEPGKPFDPDEQRFCHALARRVEPLILARGFVIRVGAVLHVEDKAAPDAVLSALAEADRVREEFLKNMRPQVRKYAAGRLYSFCRQEAAEAEEEVAPSHLRVEVLLTKPYVNHIDSGELDSNGT
jgi:hypothetical protein